MHAKFHYLGTINSSQPMKPTMNLSADPGINVQSNGLAIALLRVRGLHEFFTFLSSIVIGFDHVSLNYFYQ